MVFPQCSAQRSWANISFHYDSRCKKRVIEFKEDGEPARPMKLLLDLVRNLEENYPLDKKRIYVGGLSMGGMGTFELVRRKPGTFAAAFAICGGANVATAPKINKTAWWIFHGLKDTVVDPQFSKDMAEALKQAGADVRLLYILKMVTIAGMMLLKNRTFFHGCFLTKNEIAKQDHN